MSEYSGHPVLWVGGVVTAAVGPHPRVRGYSARVGHGEAEIQLLWPWESQVTRQRGFKVDGVMPKVHLQPPPPLMIG